MSHSTEATALTLEEYFVRFRQNVVGSGHEFQTPYGMRRLVYADWTASGRLYRTIEETLAEKIGPFVGNTHSESSMTGIMMTHAYHEARETIKRHVNAGADDVLICCGSGMTSAVNKLQRLMGLRVPEKLRERVSIPDSERPVIFVTHMEHSSNYMSWKESVGDVVCLRPNDKAMVEPEHLREELEKYRDRPLKIGSFTACSNVTGVCTPYHELARIMHEYGGWCFVDFAASAPYVDINMHPANEEERLDAVFFSPHKFLGGPGTPGIVIFNKALYNNSVPDHPGGGTVAMAGPWGYRYVDDIEAREDGGTPAFLQTMRAALSIRLKEAMGTANIKERDNELMEILYSEMRSIPGIRILADGVPGKLGIASFYHDTIHYNLFVKLLNDRFGIQARGGSSCADTYAYYLLHMNPDGEPTEKPGWLRVSVHPTMSDTEVRYVGQALRQIVENIDEWAKDYTYSYQTNEYAHNSANNHAKDVVGTWFEV